MAPTPADRPEESCDASLRPILFVHGGCGAGDNFEQRALGFR
ncbi:MAG: hypothetical protein OXT09_06795 [Myxococcales bacterium]|nr:hypothetical protein [Myxococcales bacterium]